MLIWRGEPFILPEAKAGAGRDIAWLPQAALADLLAPNASHELIFLGLNRNQAPRFCLDISSLNQPDAHTGINALMQAAAHLRIYATSLWWLIYRQENLPF